MKRPASPLKLTLMLLALLTVAGGRAADVYHVAPGGADANPGTAAAPFATLQAAVNALQPGDTLLIHSGVYRETIVFPRDGAADRPITLKPFNHERVLVSGCDPVTGWTQVDGNLWRARADWTLGRGKNELFHGGEVMREARHPNTPEPGLELPVADLNPLWPTFGAFSARSKSVSSNVARSPVNGYWNGAIYFGIHWQAWAAQSGLITDSKRNGQMSLDQTTTRWWWDDTKAGAGFPPERGRGMIVGHRHALDATGEWLREDNGDLLFLAPEGQSPEGRIEFKRRQLAFDLTNRAGIRIEGLHVRAASATLRGAENCELRNCVFEYFTHFTRFDDGLNNEIERLGDRGPLERGEVAVFVGGRGNTIRDCRFSYSAGGGLYLSGYGHVVHNNLIEEISYTGTYPGAVTVGWDGELLSGGHTITYNTMRKSGRSLMYFEGRRRPRDGTPYPYAAMLIAHNHFSDAMLVARDGGLLSSFQGNLGAYNDTRTQFHHNVVHDCHDINVIEDGWRLGIIYWDNHTQNLDGRDNLIWNKPGTVDIPVHFNAPATNVTWDGSNRFLKDHRGGAESLRPEDFPDGKVFAFGQNNLVPPPVPPWGPKTLVQLDLGGRELKPGTSLVVKDVALDDAQSLVVRYHCADLNLNQTAKSFGIFAAANNDAQSRPRQTPGQSIASYDSKTGEGTRAYVVAHADKIERSGKVLLRFDVARNLIDGECLKLPGLDLGEGYERLHLLFASRNPRPKGMEIRLDTPDATPALRIDLPDTGSTLPYDPVLLHPFKSLDVALPATLRGRHDVYFVFTGGGGEEIAQVTLIRFEQYRGPVPLLPNEAEVEIRLDRPEGELLGVLRPQATAGALNETAVKIERTNLQGRHDLHFVYRTPTTAILRLDAARLDRKAPDSAP